MKWIYACSVWIFIGVLCFYHKADWNNPVWAEAFQLWDKGKDLLLVGALLANVPKIRTSFSIIFYFCLIRFIWEIVSLATGMNINNRKVIGYIFLLFLGIWIIYLVKELRKWSKSKGYSQS